MAKRILTLCLALVIGIAFAMPAVAAVKSIKVGGSIIVNGIYRQHLDFQNSPIQNEAESWLMSTTKIWIAPNLTDNISAVVRLLNERDWNVENANSNDVNLDIAYLKIKDLGIPGFSATIGRQEILLGKGFVVGNVNGTSGCAVGTILATDLTARKSFDAMRLDYEVGTIPVTVTAFDAKIVETAPGNGDQDLWGLNVGYKTDNLNVAGYALLLDQQTDEFNHLYTFGARVDHNILPGLNYNVEAALQTGKYLGTKDMAGWAGNADVSYTFQTPMELKVGGAWFLASGKHRNDFWAPLYPDNLSDRIGRITYADMVNTGFEITGTNMSIPKVYASFKPSEKQMLSLAVFPKSTLVAAQGTDGDELGWGVDSGYTYQYTEDVSFGVLVDYAHAGDAIPTRGTHAAWQAIGTVALAF